MKSPYLWSKAPLRNIRALWYDFIYGVGNLISWAPVIWNDRDWDHSYMWRLLEKKLERMGNGHKKYSPAVDNKKLAKDMLAAAKLCKRMADENYPLNPKAKNPFLKEEQMYEKDLNQFCKLLRGARRWWW